jgi:hypothetical protein
MMLTGRLIADYFGADSVLFMQVTVNFRAL